MSVRTVGCLLSDQCWRRFLHLTASLPPPSPLKGKSCDLLIVLFSVSSIQTFDSLFQVINITSGASGRADTFVRFAEPGTTNSTLQAGRRERATSNKPAEPGHWGRSDRPFSGPIQNRATPAARPSSVLLLATFNHHHRRRRSSLFRQTRLGRVQRAERFAHRLSACFPSRLSVPAPVALVASTRASFQFPELRSAPRTLAVVKKGPAHHSALISGTPSTLVPSFRVASFREQSRPLLLLRLNQSVLVDPHCCLALASHRPRLSQRDLSQHRPTDRPHESQPPTINRDRRLFRLPGLTNAQIIARSSPRACSGVPSRSRQSGRRRTNRNQSQDSRPIRRQFPLR